MDGAEDFFKWLLTDITDEEVARTKRILSDRTKHPNDLRWLAQVAERHKREAGFTLIELLVVCLIIGILSAMALPSFLSQVTKAHDVAAMELVHTGEVVSVAYADEHGTYEGLTPAYLHEQEPTIEVAAGEHPYVSEAHGGATGYSVTAVASGGDSFTYAIGESNGVVERVCKPAGKGSCRADGTWG
jgi:type IV pilus assembly protein PilA